MIELTTQHPNLGIIRQLPMVSRRQAANVTYAKSRHFKIQFTLISRNDNQKINGICTVAMRKNNGEYLVGVYVIPEARRQGIGRCLVSSALVEAGRRGWTLIAEAITPAGLALIETIPGVVSRSTW